MQTYNESSWCRVSHNYEKSEGKEDRYSISFTGDDSFALLALVDGTWEMTVERVYFINCPKLKYLQYIQLPNTDFSNVSNISTFIIEDYYGSRIDLSCLKGLRKLICRGNERLITLDLYKE